MVQSSLIYLPELLEQILYFLAIDNSLYSALFVSRLWYRYAIPSLWKYIELKKNDLKYGHYFSDNYTYQERDRTRYKRFIKLMNGKHKPAYVSNVIHLEITYYHLLSDKKIKSIVDTFPNIIHLDFKNSIGFGNKSLFIIAESYPNLRYLNLWDIQAITDKGLCAIIRSSSVKKLDLGQPPFFLKYM
jgi:hypothetical protein